MQVGWAAYILSNPILSAVDVEPERNATAEFALCGVLKRKSEALALHEA